MDFNTSSRVSAIGRFLAWWHRQSHGLRGAVWGIVLALPVSFFTPLGVFAFLFLALLQRPSEALGWPIVKSSGGPIAFPVPTTWGLLFLLPAGALIGWFIASSLAVMRRGPGHGNRVTALFWRCIVAGVVAGLAIAFTIVLPSIVEKLPLSVRCRITGDAAKHECYYQMFKETGDASICMDSSRVGTGTYAYDCRKKADWPGTGLEPCEGLDPFWGMRCVSDLAALRHDVTLCEQVKTWASPGGYRYDTLGHDYDACIRKASGAGQ
jgi:hypothetical protein